MVATPTVDTACLETHLGNLAFFTGAVAQEKEKDLVYDTLERGTQHIWRNDSSKLTHLFFYRNTFSFGVFLRVEHNNVFWNGVDVDSGPMELGGIIHSLLKPVEEAIKGDL